MKTHTLGSALAVVVPFVIPGSHGNDMLAITATEHWYTETGLCGTVLLL